MKNVYPHFFADFQCLKGGCPDSCCQGWEVDVDSDTLAFYGGISGDIKNRIDSVLGYDEFGNRIFRLTQDQRCPFLNSADLCDIHIVLGVEHTPLTCRNFPKFINNYGALTETGFSFSCPVAAKLMWEDKNAFDFCEECTPAPPHCNDIDASLFYELKHARQKAFDIVQNENAAQKEKAKQLLDFGAALQKDIKKQRKGSKKTPFFTVFKNPELINAQWQKKLEKPNGTPIKLNTVSAQNILMYFIYRYFLDAVYDKDVISKLRLAVLGLLIPAYFGNDCRTVQLWSKETEHSDVNMQSLRRNLKTADSLRENALIERIDEILL